MLRQALKRVSVVLLEITAESLLLGGLFSLLLIPGHMNSFIAVVISPLPVIVVLYLHGYYLTRPLIGIAWGAKKSWLYAGVAAVLFSIHMSVAIARLWPDISPEGRGAALPFLAGGTAIIFSCALAGRKCLSNWASP